MSELTPRRPRFLFAILTAVLLSPLPAAFASAAESPAKPAATPPAAAAETKLEDRGWPREYTLSDGGKAVMYQPQIATWGQKEMVAWAAISYQAPGKKEAALGTGKIAADTLVSVEDRLVRLQNLRFTEINFPSMPREEQQRLASALQGAMPDEDRVISLDRVLANIDKSQISGKSSGAPLKADPPKIFQSTTPAVLLNIDGQPVWSPIKDVDLKFAANTNWDLFQSTDGKTFYLRNEVSWLTAPKVDGPWTPAGTLPASFGKLPSDDNWTDVKANLPGKPLATNAVPKVFVAYEPAEFILLNGAPKYEPVPGTKLSWVSNTESDLFRVGTGGDFYYLIAGRWFSAPKLEGPWTFATPSLPPDFKQIPIEHPRSRVLASVPGTDQAAEAVLLAQVPRTARVNKNEVKAPEVVYEGEPKFEAIPETTVARAVNTDKDVLQAGGKYYLCYEGIWFVADGAAGPFVVASSVPQEIYSIPPSSPSYNLTYVTVEDDDPNDEYVEAAYAAGYTGLMVGWGVSVWGSGWYYPPYYWYGGYYPFMPTYGFGAWYNPWTGTYGRAAAVYGPYGGAGMAAAYNPRTGTYARGAAAYGPYNARMAGEAFNPRTGTYAKTRQGANVYGSWGSSYVQRGDSWARTGHVRTDNGVTRGARGSEGGGIVTHRGDQGSGFVARGEGGDMYAGRDGNVYKNTGEGWEQIGSGESRPKEGLSPEQRGQLDKDRSARQSGSQRSRDSSSYSRGSMPRSSMGSYRPSGRMGGGGRRR